MVFVYFCMLTLLHQSDVYATDTKGNDKAYIIGIYTHCQNSTNESIQHAHSRKIANYVSRTTQYYIKYFEDRIFVKSVTLRYKSYLTCGSMDSLASILSNLVLNKTFVFLQNERCAYRRLNWQGGNLLVVTYLPEYQEKFLISITSSYNIKVRSYSGNTWYESLGSPYVYPYYDDFVFRTMVSFLDSLKTKHIDILMLGSFDNNQDLILLGEKVFSHFSEGPAVCVKLAYISNETAIAKIMNHFKRVDSVVIFIGADDLLLPKFLKNVYKSPLIDMEGSNNRTWLYYPERQQGIYEFPSLFTIANGFRSKSFERIMVNETFQDIFSIVFYFYHPLFRPVTGVNQTCYWNYLLNKYFNLHNGLKETFSSKPIFYNDIKDGKYEWDNTATWTQKPLQCPSKLNCSPGQENYFGVYKPELKVNQRGWFCTSCTSNFYKRGFGMHPCIECPKYTKANNDNTSCYDPYRQVQLSLEESRSQLVVALNALGVTSCIIVVLIFVIFRKTPMVKSCDTFMTVLEITKIFVFFVIIPILFMGAMTPFSCYLRPITIGLLQTLHVSIMLTKSHKLYTIFNSMIRLSRKEYLKTSATQVFCVFILMCVDGAIIMIAVTIQPISTVTKKNFNQPYTQTTYCNSNPIIMQQIPLFLLIMSLCLFQAYRCRNFPGKYNESMKVIYSTFISFILHLILVILYYTQRDVFDKEVAIMLVFAVNNAVLLIINYGWRCYIIILKPKKNTKEEFRENFNKHMQGQMIAFQTTAH